MVVKNSICRIEISVDETYNIESTENKAYNVVLNPYNRDDNGYSKVFAIHVDLFDKMLDIALVGDMYSDDNDCAVLENDVLTVLQNDVVVQINVYDGSLLLCKKIGDFGCNFGIYKVKMGYIIYGEMEITLLDFQFNEKWSFSGCDIFVSISGKTPFQLCENSIKLYDFLDNFYEIDYHGKLIREELLK